METVSGRSIPHSLSALFCRGRVVKGLVHALDGLVQLISMSSVGFDQLIHDILGFLNLLLHLLPEAGLLLFRSLFIPVHRHNGLLNGVASAVWALVMVVNVSLGKPFITDFRLEIIPYFNLRGFFPLDFFHALRFPVPHVRSVFEVVSSFSKHRVIHVSSVMGALRGQERLILHPRHSRFGNNINMAVLWVGRVASSVVVSSRLSPSVARLVGFVNLILVLFIWDEFLIILMVIVLFIFLVLFSSIMVFLCNFRLVPVISRGFPMLVIYFNFLDMVLNGSSPWRVSLMISSGGFMFFRSSSVVLTMLVFMGSTFHIWFIRGESDKPTLWDGLLLDNHSIFIHCSFSDLLAILVLFSLLNNSGCSRAGSNFGASRHEFMLVADFDILFLGSGGGSSRGVIGSWFLGSVGNLPTAYFSDTVWFIF